MPKARCKASSSTDPSDFRCARSCRYAGTNAHNDYRVTTALPHVLRSARSWSALAASSNANGGYSGGVKSPRANEAILIVSALFLALFVSLFATNRPIY